MERLMRQFIKQLRPRNETYTPPVEKIQSSLNEGGSTIGATEMESHIVIAFNGGYDNAPETYGVSKKDYESGKDISEKIAKDIQRETKAPKNSMIHFGKGNGQMISWWKGKPTPKTDLYSTDGKTLISLKQKGGSQLMSGLLNETKSTFRAATEYMDNNAPKETEKLVNMLGGVLKDIEVQGNINSIAQAIKTKIVPKKIVAKKGKKEVTIKIDKKKYEQEMQNMVNWKKEMKQTGQVFKKFFEENYDFKKWFCYEAATGETKFRPDKYANSTWVVEFDPVTGANNNINRLSLGNNKPSPYMEKVTKKANIRISPKTGSGSRVRSDLTARTSGSLRIDIKDEFLGFKSYHKTEDNFSNFMETSFKEFIDGLLLTEEPLNEIKILNQVKNWFKNVTKRLIQKIKELAKKGIQFIMKFFGFEPDKIETSGLELFGY